LKQQMENNVWSQSSKLWLAGLNSASEAPRQSLNWDEPAKLELAD